MGLNFGNGPLENPELQPSDVSKGSTLDSSKVKKNNNPIEHDNADQVKLG